MFIEKKRVDSCNAIVKEINSRIKRFTLKNYRLHPSKTINSTDLTIENKKQRLIRELHDVLVMSFAVDIKKIKKESLLRLLRNNISIAREIVIRLRDINYYIEKVILNKSSIRRSVNQLSKQRYNVWIREKKRLKDCEKLFMEQLFGLNPSKHLKIKAISQKNSIKKQTSLLCSLEAKLPPPQNIRPILLNSTHFSVWASAVLSLLAGIETNQGHVHEKQKIKDIIKEKAYNLSVQESQSLTTDMPDKPDKRLRKAIIEWFAAEKL